MMYLGPPAWCIERLNDRDIIAADRQTYGGRQTAETTADDDRFFHASTLPPIQPVRIVCRESPGRRVLANEFDDLLGHPQGIFLMSKMTETDQLHHAAIFDKASDFERLARQDHAIL